jgi:hypothetical protein
MCCASLWTTRRRSRLKTGAPQKRRRHSDKRLGDEKAFQTAAAAVVWPPLALGASLACCPTYTNRDLLLTHARHPEARVQASLEGRLVRAACGFSAPLPVNVVMKSPILGAL